MLNGSVAAELRSRKEVQWRDTMEILLFEMKWQENGERVIEAQGI